MKCSQVQKHVALLVGGDLPRETEKAIKEHMNTCLGCYREYQDYLAAMAALKKLSVRPDVSGVLEGLAADVIEQIHEVPSGRAAAVPVRLDNGLFSAVLRVAAAAAVVVMLVAGGFIIGQSTRPDDASAGLRGAGTPVHADGTHIVLPGRGLDQAVGGEEPEPEYFLLNPQQLPRVQPVSNRQRF